jgi:murein DD-endopeptidase MepM/ murein hydrolase activator NlpD
MNQAQVPSFRWLPRSEEAFLSPQPAEPELGLDATEDAEFRFYPPYSLERVLSTFNDCRGRRQHRGLDLAGVGEDMGLGTPIFAMAHSEVLLIGTPDLDRDKFGTWDKRSGSTERAKTMLPRSKEIEGYGKVHFFTRKNGSWNSGVVLVTRIMGGPLDGHILRYMHMAAIHPELEVGDILEPGQEIALMGGTAIRSSSPHVHLDLEDPLGTRIDLAPYLGLEADTKPVLCKRKKKKR